MSSPHHHQSNGKAENAVKIAKKILQKSLDSGEDPYLSLLAWRNTPSKGFDSSPAQRLISRRTRTLLPIKKDLLKPKILKNVESQLQKKKKLFKKNNTIGDQNNWKF